MELRSLSRAGVLLFALSLLRVGWEGLRRPPELLEEGASEAAALMEASREAMAREAARKRPLAPGETVDPNRAAEEELDRLPGVGPAVARAIVQDREENGAFTRPEDLLRVRGIGEATLGKLRPHLDFGSGLPTELRRGSSLQGRATGDAPRRLTGPGSAETGDTAPPLLDVNTATEDELETLPGIGPALARRILESREGEGAFLTPEDLLRVPGIGPATLARIRDRILPRD